MTSCLRHEEHNDVERGSPTSAARSRAMASLQRATSSGRMSQFSAVARSILAGPLEVRSARVAAILGRIADTARSIRSDSELVWTNMMLSLGSQRGVSYGEGEGLYVYVCTQQITTSIWRCRHGLHCIRYLIHGPLLAPGSLLRLRISQRLYTTCDEEQHASDPSLLGLLPASGKKKLHLSRSRSRDYRYPGMQYEINLTASGVLKRFLHLLLGKAIVSHGVGSCVSCGPVVMVVWRMLCSRLWGLLQLLLVSFRASGPVNNEQNAAHLEPLH